MKKNILIAVTVLVSLCLLVWGIEFLKGINMFKPSNYYYAKFEKIDGLSQASPVTINGFQVGLVKEINYDYETNMISVMMSLDDELKIPAGTTASVESSLTGTSTLKLTLGDSKQYVEVGGELQGVAPAGLMEQLAGNTLPQVNNILPKVDSIMGNVNGLVGNPALAQSIARLDAITLELAKSSQQLTLLMNNLNKNVPGVMNNVNGITSNLSTTTSNLDEFTTNLNNMPLDSTVNNLNSAIANIQSLTEKLNDKNSTVGLLLNDKSLYNNADHAVASLDSLFIDIKKNPKRYINVKIF
ncbi:MAG: MCE family protein [Bacteroidales bacterium]|uniref:MlaD family protein n=1 Tax=Sodaliphilus sp. TaxID=2815818 RepID=UPI001B6E55C9|nr:MCE family protein [Candidatus Sodaliphilus limicaballi]